MGSLMKELIYFKFRESCASGLGITSPMILAAKKWHVRTQGPAEQKGWRSRCDVQEALEASW